MRMTEAPCPQPRSATRPPLSNFSWTPLRNGIQLCVRCARYRKKASAAVNRRQLCSCQPTPLPERKAARIWSSSYKKPELVRMYSSTHEKIVTRAPEWTPQTGPLYFVSPICAMWGEFSKSTAPSDTSSSNLRSLPPLALHISCVIVFQR